MMLVAVQTSDFPMQVARTASQKLVVLTNMLSLNLSKVNACTKSKNN